MHLRKNQGFSLLEIMIVVLIIGLLAGGIALTLSGNVTQARQNRAKSDIAVIVKAVEQYRLNEGVYPSNRDGLDVLDIDGTLDPWGRPYQYETPGPGDRDYLVITYGADGREGGDDEAADVSSATFKQ